MKTLKIPNLKSFKEDFIQPLCTFTDCARIKVSGDTMSYFVHDAESNLFIVNEYDISEANNMFMEDFFLDMKNLKKFLAFLNSLAVENLVLTIHSNYIMYESSDIKIKMYNADAVTMRIPKISLSFIRGIEFDIVFDISKDITSKINTLGGMVDNADKLYFTKDGDYIFATFTDESLSNVDSVSFKVSEYMNDNFETFIII